VYAAEYDAAVLHDFPPFPRGLAGKYYDEGLRYFSAFDGFGDQYEILSVEDRFELDLRGNRFVGVADLILRDKATGEITVIDHKSKSMKSLMKELRANKRQLYLYAAHVKQRFGVFPSLLRFSMFRYGENVDEPFSMDAYEEMLDWTEQTVRRIRNTLNWQVHESGYFCRYICSVRDHCPVGQTIMNSGRPS
jgi:RecB family exonuclease